MLLTKLMPSNAYFPVAGAWLLTFVVAFASPAVVQGGTVAFTELVPLQTASSGDTTTTLPAPLLQVDPGQSFVVEIWARTDDTQGLSSVSMTIQFDPAISVVNGVIHTTLFSELSSGTADNVNGLVVGLSGSHLSTCADQVGVTPTWARVAILNMQATGSGIIVVESADTGLPALGTAICGVGDLLPSQVSFGTATLTVTGSPIPTVSHWGMIILVLMLLSVGTLVFTRQSTFPAVMPSESVGTSSRC